MNNGMREAKIIISREKLIKGEKEKVRKNMISRDCEEEGGSGGGGGGVSGMGKRMKEEEE